MVYLEDGEARERIAKAYDAFIERWGFRPHFIRMHESDFEQCSARAFNGAELGTRNNILRFHFHVGCFGDKVCHPVLR